MYDWQYVKDIYLNCGQMHAMILNFVAVIIATKAVTMESLKNSRLGRESNRHRIKIIAII